MGSNSKSVGANTVKGRGELEGVNSIWGESGGYRNNVIYIKLILFEFHVLCGVCSVLKIFKAHGTL